MRRKVALFAFNGDPTCFVHVLLNALDMHEKGYDVKLVIEGAATKLVEAMNYDDHPLYELYRQVKSKRLVHCVCAACAKKMGTIEVARDQKLPLCGPMKGHPSIAEYQAHGYEIITF